MCNDPRCMMWPRICSKRSYSNRSYSNRSLQRRARRANWRISSTIGFVSKRCRLQGTHRIWLRWSRTHSCFFNAVNRLGDKFAESTWSFCWSYIGYCGTAGLAFWNPCHNLRRTELHLPVNYFGKVSFRYKHIYILEGLSPTLPSHPLEPVLEGEKQTTWSQDPLASSNCRLMHRYCSFSQLLLLQT